MLLIVFLFFVQIELLSCLFEKVNKQEEFLNQINRERTNLGRENLQIHLTLQLAAEKRCTNREELIRSYQRMLSKTYRNDDWTREEQLQKIFPIVEERIDFIGEDIRNDLMENSPHISSLYQANIIFIGFAESEHQNFSARCILYGSSSNLLSNHHRLLRLLYILIGCGILLLSLIICSMINDRRRTKLEEQLIENRQTIIPQKSMRDRRTMARVGSGFDQRSSAIHSFFQSPK